MYLPSFETVTERMFRKGTICLSGSSADVSEDSMSVDDNLKSVADSTTSSLTFAFKEGEEVLWRNQDGLLFLGVIVEIEPETASCLIRFGDCTEKWSHFGDLRRLDDEEPEPDLKPPSLPPVLAPAHQKSNFAPLLYSPGKDVIPQHVLLARKELPYDFDSLLWDENHQRNDKERYCYCGESGDWYRKMLQCNQCLQWFHQDCIRMAHSSPLLLGDRFFDFVCTICTGTSEEILRRVDLTHVDALHLVLFNLTIMNSKKFHNLEFSIIPFLKSRWKMLQGPGKVLKLSCIEPHYLSSLLNANKSRFKSGLDVRNRSAFWGLKNVAPPFPPPLGNLTFSNGSVYSDNSISSQKLRRKKRLFSNHCVAKQNPARKISPIFPQKKREFSLMKNFKRKRGRPSNLKPRDSFDSCCSSDTSSSGTLDTLIPFPPNFEGFNNPFRDVDNCLRKILKSPSGNLKSVIKIDQQFSQKQSPRLLENFQMSLSSIFADSSLSSVQGTMVCAKRITTEGKVEYLVERDEPGAPIKLENQ